MSACDNTHNITQIYDISSYYGSLSLPGFSVTFPWAFIWFSDGNESKVVIFANSTK